MNEGDKAFIFSTWLNNFKADGYFAIRVKPEIYFAKHHAIIEYILEKKSTTVYVASSKADHNHIFGYAVCEKSGDDDIIHYAFVKSSFQKFGIFKNILKHAGIDFDKSVVTHWTRAMNTIVNSHPGLTYDPYRL